jgi:L-rhamnonate dehydratase
MARLLSVKAVRAFVPAAGAVGTDYTVQPAGHWIVDSLVANPMSMYPRYRELRTSWGIGVLGTALVEVELDNGIVGVGTTTGGPPACWLIEHHLKRFVVGQDPRNVETIWDQMWRASLPHGRKGLPIHAVSAVDLALWDAIGKACDEPVCRLLGGPGNERIPVYTTTARPDLAREMGFKSAKIPLVHDPAEGHAGLLANVEIFRDAREKVGPDFDLMLDCYMALTVPYAVELARALDPYRLSWLEEALPPDDYDGYAELKMRLPHTRITTGEHEYTRYGFRELISRRAADILQPDMLFCGGITEARRIVAMAAAYDLPVIPHGSSVFSYHLVAAFPNCPMAEFLMMSPNADRIVPVLGGLFTNEPLPADGHISLPDRPGFGVELNPALELRRPHPAD